MTAIANEQQIITLPEAGPEAPIPAPRLESRIAKRIEAGNAESSAVIANIGAAATQAEREDLKSRGFDVEAADSLDMARVEAAWAAVAKSRKPQGQDTPTQPDLRV